MKHLLLMISLVLSVSEARSAETLSDLNNQLFGRIRDYESSAQESQEAAEIREKFEQVAGRAHKEAASASEQIGEVGAYVYAECLLRAMEAEALPSRNPLKWFSKKEPLLSIEKGLDLLVLEPLSVHLLRRLVEPQLKLIDRARMSKAEEQLKIITNPFQAKVALAVILYKRKRGDFSYLDSIVNPHQASFALQLLKLGLHPQASFYRLNGIKTFDDLQLAWIRFHSDLGSILPLDFERSVSRFFCRSALSQEGPGPLIESLIGQ